MIQVLDATTKSLQAVMSGAAATTNPSFTAAWGDDTGSAFTEGSTDGAFNGATPVTLVAAPASSTRRTVKSLVITNIDTAPVTITISYNDNATLRTIAAVTLAVGDYWTFEGTYNSSGTLKVATSTVNAPGGSNTQLQYNNSGSFGGITGATTNGTAVTLVAPVLGAATATSINGLIITTTAGTLTIANNASASLITSGNFALTLTSTNTTNSTFPAGTHTLAGLDVNQTWSGTQTYGDSVIVATTPKIVTGLKDTNGNAWLNVTATGSAVNSVTITNAATGTAGPIIAAAGETNVDLKIAAKGTGKIHYTTGAAGDITAYSPSAAGTATLTLNTSNIHTITMPAGNITIALSNEAVGQCFMINILQDGTGSRTVTWFTTIKWAGGSAPTLTTTASKIDTLGFIVTSAGNYQGYVVGQNI